MDSLDQKLLAELNNELARAKARNYIPVRMKASWAQLMESIELPQVDFGEYVTNVSAREAYLEKLLKFVVYRHSKMCDAIDSDREAMDKLRQLFSG